MSEEATNVKMQLELQAITSSEGQRLIAALNDPKLSRMDKFVIYSQTDPNIRDVVTGYNPNDYNSTGSMDTVQAERFGFDKYLDRFVVPSADDKPKNATSNSSAMIPQVEVPYINPITGERKFVTGGVNPPAGFINATDPRIYGGQRDNLAVDQGYFAKGNYADLRPFMTGRQDGEGAVQVDQNIGDVRLAGKSTDYTYQQAGNQLRVFDKNNKLVSIIPVQGDQDGTKLTFDDGSTFAKGTKNAAGSYEGGLQIGGVAAGAFKGLPPPPPGITTVVGGNGNDGIPTVVGGNGNDGTPTVVGGGGTTVITTPPLVGGTTIDANPGNNVNPLTSGTSGVVYGPDGTMYSSAAAALAAGVRNYSYSKPMFAEEQRGLISSADLVPNLANAGNVNPGGLITGANSQLFTRNTSVNFPTGTAG